MSHPITIWETSLHDLPLPRHHPHRQVHPSPQFPVLQALASIYHCPWTVVGILTSNGTGRPSVAITLHTRSNQAFKMASYSCPTMYTDHDPPAPSQLTCTPFERENKWGPVCTKCVCVHVCVCVCVFVRVYMPSALVVQHQRWILQGEAIGPGADVTEGGGVDIDIDWNGSEGEIATGVHLRFTELINKMHLSIYIYIFFLLIFQKYPWGQGGPQVRNHTFGKAGHARNTESNPNKKCHRCIQRCVRGTFRL